MKKLFFVLLAFLSLSLTVFAQTTPSSAQNNPKPPAETKKRPPIFRANKDQVTQVQKMLKVTESGKLDQATRASIKTYQGANGLKTTGTLNRATLEKMGIALTDKQKAILVSQSSFASASTGKSGTAKTHSAIFRASKD